jgi:hypothetical protein
VTTEKYLIKSASGMVAYHGNTPYDVLIALVAAKAKKALIKEIVRSYIASQDVARGCWFLRDESSVDHAVSTWPTAEAVEAIGQAVDALGAEWEGTIGRDSMATRLALLVAAAFALVEGAVLVGLPGSLGRWWSGLPQEAKDGTVLALAIGTVGSLSAAALTAAGRRAVRGITSWLLGRVRG